MYARPSRKTQKRKRKEQHSLYIEEQKKTKQKKQMGMIMNEIEKNK